MSMLKTRDQLARAAAACQTANAGKREMLALIERRHSSTFLHGNTIVSFTYTPAIVSSVSRDGTAQEVRIAAPPAYGVYRVKARDWHTILVDARGQCGNPAAVCAALVDDRGFAIEYDTRDKAVAAIKTVIAAPPKRVA